MPSPFSIMSGPNPFSLIPTAQQEETSAEAQRTRKRTALMAGVASLALDGEASQNVGQSIGEARDRYDAVGEEQIRLESGLRRQQARVQAIQALSPDTPGVRMALGDILTRPPEDVARGALEDEYADQLLLASQMNPSNTDPDPAYYDIFASMADREAKRMVWERLTNDIWEEREGRRWINAVGEAIFIQGIPARNSMTQTGVLSEYGLTQGFWDNLVAGGAVREESAQFHNLMEDMTTEEFEVFATALAGEIRHRNEILGFTDLSFTQQMMEDLLDAPPGFVTNAMNLIDNIPFVTGLARGGRSLVNLSIRMGSRGNAADILVESINRGSRGGIDEAVEAIGAEDAAEVFGPAAPTSINPHGAPSNIPIALDVNDRVDSARDLLEQLTNGGDFLPTRRLDSAESMAARAEARARLEARVGREAVDFHVEPVRLADGSHTDEVVGVFGRKDGQGGYTTPQGAARAAREAGFEIDVDDPTQVFQRIQDRVEPREEFGKWGTEEEFQQAAQAEARQLDDIRGYSREYAEEIPTNFDSIDEMLEDANVQTVGLLRWAAESAPTLRPLSELLEIGVKDGRIRFNTAPEFVPNMRMTEGISASNTGRFSGTNRVRFGVLDTETPFSVPHSRNEGFLLQSGFRAETVLHEFVHSATVHRLNMDATTLADPLARSSVEAFQREADDLFNIVDRRINELYSRQASTLSDTEQSFLQNLDIGNTFRNVDELFAWGLSNAEASAFLRTIKIPRAARSVVSEVSAWQRFSRMVLSVFKKPGAAVSETELTAFDKLNSMLERSIREDLPTDATAWRSMSERTTPNGTLELGDDQSWFFKASMPVREMGFYTAKLDSNSSNILSTFLLNGRINSDRSLAAAATLSEGTAARLQRDIVETFGVAIRRIPRKERDVAAEIWQMGNNESRWYSRDRFRQLYQTQTGSDQYQKAWEAYELAQRYNDIDYLIRRDSVWKSLHTQGYESMTMRNGPFGEDDVVAREVSSITGDFLDAETGRVYREGAQMDLPDNYIVVRLQEGHKTGDGWAVRTVIGHRSSFQFAPLRRDILPYRPGGHRMPQGSHFVKQAVRHTQPDGTNLLMSPRAFISARNIAEAGEWVKHMDAARIIMRDAEDLGDPAVYRQLSELLEGRTGYPDVDELLKMAEDGRIGLNDAFEVVPDRGMPSVYRGRRTLDGAMYDPDEVADITWARSKGGMYYGHRGEDVLQDWQGNGAPTLNMMQVMQRSLNNITQLMSFGDYKMESLARFRQTYGQAGHGLLSETAGMSDMDFLMNAPLKPGLPEALRQGMAANRNQIRRILNVPSESAQLIQRVQRQFIDYMVGTDPTSARAKAATVVGDWWLESDGVNALRLAAFDLKLGLFNVAQLPLQISTTAAALSMSPKWGGQGIMNFIPARIHMLNPNTLETLISRGVHKAVGMEAEEYRSYMNSLRQSGFFKIKGSHSLMAETGAVAAMDGFTSGVQRAADTARFFFYEAETMNRLVASHIAWKELREQASDLDYLSPEFRRQWMGRTDDYAFNMSNSSRASWQKGVLSIPTQFWSYPVRMMEAMLGPNFSRRQRAQLLIGQSLLYGPAVGIPGASMAAYLMEKFGITDPEADTPELRSLRGFYDRGGLDIMANILSGGDLDLRIGERIGVGTLPEQIVRDFFGDPQFGESSAVNLVGGATWSIWNDIGEDFYQVGKYALAEAGQSRMPATVENLRRLAMNASSISNMTKAYMIHNYGRLISSEFRHLADVPNEYAFAAALSVQPNVLAEMSQDFAYIGKDDELVDELVDLITLHRRRLVDATDMAEREALQQDIGLITRLFTPNVIRRARERVGDAFISDIASSVDINSRRRQLEEDISDSLVEIREEEEN